MDRWGAGRSAPQSGEGEGEGLLWSCWTRVAVVGDAEGGRLDSFGCGDGGAPAPVEVVLGSARREAVDVWVRAVGAPSVTGARCRVVSRWWWAQVSGCLRT
ncbi:hypothetical protein GCM10009560_12330 [Nonomuraea longicatena]|uniref:Uncharacterized protein n=1 Tax=Nonomuraea longicatena TaxID=83682 RepID=A0ABP3Z7Q5_9ACTN